MTPLLFAMPGNEALSGVLARQLRWEQGAIEVRQFPDGETYLRFGTACAGRRIALVCTLDRPDPKALPVLFAAEAARDLGAHRIGLVAPYLAYMRQDRRFRDGEAITSRSFATLVSSRLDWLATIDPHLHRFRSLDELYPIETRVVHSAPALAAWIRTHVAQPVLIGPDAESEQWVADVARQADAPYVVLEKVRRGDRDVEVSAPRLGRWSDRNPVIVDDIVSSARTMIEAVRHILRAELPAPVCVGVHAIFAGEAYRELLLAGAARVATTNSIPHPSNDIDVTPLLAAAIAGLA